MSSSGKGRGFHEIIEMKTEIERLYFRVLSLSLVLRQSWQYGCQRVLISMQSRSLCLRYSEHVENAGAASICRRQTGVAFHTGLSPSLDYWRGSTLVVGIGGFHILVGKLCWWCGVWMDEVGMYKKFERLLSLIQLFTQSNVEP